MAKDFFRTLDIAGATKTLQMFQRMRKATFLVAGDAQRRAPIGPTGNLRSNVFVNIRFQGPAVIGEIVFLEPYAEKQHEEVTYIHPIGGESEYLDKAMAENLGKVQRILAGK